MTPEQAQVWGFILLVALIWIASRRRPWRPTGTAHGTSRFCARADLLAAGMLNGPGFILGRTLQRRELIRARDYCHTLLVGGTGTGKGVGIIIPWLLSSKNSCIVFDTKSDLHETTAATRERMGHRNVCLSPFGRGKDTLNPLDAIPDGPLLVDHARALAESIVVRQGTEPDPHWNDSAVMVITAVLVFVLKTMAPHHRNLNSVREIISDVRMLDAAADKLRGLGGIPARMGNGLLGLQDKEKSGILSTAGRHLAFLDSERVAASVATSTFDPAQLARERMSVFIQIPPEMLEAQRGLLRCWVSTLVKSICSTGGGTEVMCLFDEASALGNLSALEEVLVRGRSAGARLLLAYQSDAQIRDAFKDKPTLIYDNCSTQIYLGASSYETAERVSKMLGDATITVETGNSSTSSSRSYGGSNPNEQPRQVNSSEGRNWSEQARALLTPSEVLTLDSRLLLVFIQGMNPILARKIRWYSDPLFRRGLLRATPLMWWAILAALVAVLMWSFCN